jgi:hypothetical protein
VELKGADQSVLRSDIRFRAASRRAGSSGAEYQPDRLRGPASVIARRAVRTGKPDTTTVRLKPDATIVRLKPDATIDLAPRSI